MSSSESDSDVYEVSADVEANWVDAQLDRVEQEGRYALGRVYTLVNNAETLSDDDLAVVFSDDETEFSEDEGAALPVDAAEFRRLIGEKIWDKLRPEPSAEPAARKDVYEDEDTQMGWRTADPTRKTSDQWTTEYADRGAIDDRRATADEGRVMGPDGQPMTGDWGWVIDAATGSLLFFDPARVEVTDPNSGVSYETTTSQLLYYLAQGYTIRSYHHTTPVAGFPVTGAGLVTLENGYIAKINDQSGHYRPEGEQMYQSVRGLEDDGYLLQRPADAAGGFRDAQITLTGRSGGGRPTDKAEWLDAEQAKNPAFPTGDVTLRSEQFLQTEGNEQQIRLKQALNTEIENYDASDTSESASDISSDWSSESSDSYSSESSSESGAASEDGDVSGEGDEPEAEHPKVTWDQVDWGFVRRANEALLKDTAAGQSLPYWQVGAGVVIGTEQPLTYRRLFEELRGEAAPSGDRPSGYIQVRSRGGVGTRGRIEVTGDYEEDTFKAEIRQFSNKEIRFA